MAVMATYSGSDRQQQLEAGARKEGELRWYSASLVEAASAPIAAAFMQKYPFVKVEAIQLDGAAMLSRYRDEANAGQHTADVLEAPYLAISGLDKLGLLQPFSSPLTKDLPPQLYAGDHAFIGDQQVPLGVATNTKIIPDGIAPRSYDDLLKRDLKGKLSTQDTSQAVRFTGAMALIKGEDFVRRLGGQNVVMSNQSADAVVASVASGEVAVTFPASLWTARRPDLKNAPVRWIPLDPVPVDVGYAAIARSAPHPYAALLFLDFLLSQSGQEQYAKAGSGPVRQGAGTQSGSPSFKPFYPDQQVSGDYDATYAQWSKLHHDVFRKR